MAKNLSILHWQSCLDGELQELFALAQKVKKKANHYKGAALDKSLIMLFQKSSTRTRLAFELAMQELGGRAIYLDWQSTNFRLSKIAYESICLAQHADLLAARMKKHEDLVEIHNNTNIPLINACCDRYHPCQALTDALTMYEDGGPLRGAELCYVGVHNNIANSLMEIACVFGIKLTLVCPIQPEGIVDTHLRNKLTQQGLLRESLDAKASVDNADYVYTDTWLDLEFYGRREHMALQEERILKMRPYQINHKLMRDSKARILHDMPIHSGYEISAEMVEDSRSLIFKQAANRLPVQKAMILYLLELV